MSKKEIKDEETETMDLYVTREMRKQMEEEIEKRGITMNQLIKESINHIFKQDMRAIEIRMDEEQKIHDMLQERLKKKWKEISKL